LALDPQIPIDQSLILYRSTYNLKAQYVELIPVWKHVENNTSSTKQIKQFPDPKMSAQIGSVSHNC